MGKVKQRLMDPVWKLVQAGKVEEAVERMISITGWSREECEEQVDAIRRFDNLQKGAKND